MIFLCAFVAYVVAITAVAYRVADGRWPDPRRLVAGVARKELLNLARSIARSAAITGACGLMVAGVAWLANIDTTRPLYSPIGLSVALIAGRLIDDRFSGGLRIDSGADETAGVTDNSGVGEPYSQVQTDRAVRGGLPVASARFQ